MSYIELRQWYLEIESRASDALVVFHGRVDDKGTTGRHALDSRIDNRLFIDLKGDKVRLVGPSSELQSEAAGTPIPFIGAFRDGIPPAFEMLLSTFIPAPEPTSPRPSLLSSPLSTPTRHRGDLGEGSSRGTHPCTASNAASPQRLSAAELSAIRQSNRKGKGKAVEHSVDDSSDQSPSTATAKGKPARPRKSKSQAASPRRHVELHPRVVAQLSSQSDSTSPMRSNAESSASPARVASLRTLHAISSSPTGSLPDHDDLADEIVDFVLADTAAVGSLSSPLTIKSSAVHGSGIQTSHHPPSCHQASASSPASAGRASPGPTEPDSTGHARRSLSALHLEADAGTRDASPSSRAESRLGRSTRTHTDDIEPTNAPMSDVVEEEAATTIGRYVLPSPAPSGRPPKPRQISEPATEDDTTSTQTAIAQAPASENADAVRQTPDEEEVAQDASEVDEEVPMLPAHEVPPVAAAAAGDTDNNGTLGSRSSQSPLPSKRMFVAHIETSAVHSWSVTRYDTATASRSSTPADESDGSTDSSRPSPVVIIPISSRRLSSESSESSASSAGSNDGSDSETGSESAVDQEDVIAGPFTAARTRSPAKCSSTAEVAPVERAMPDLERLSPVDHGADFDEQAATDLEWASERLPSQLPELPELPNWLELPELPELPEHQAVEPYMPEDQSMDEPSLERHDDAPPIASFPLCANGSQSTDPVPLSNTSQQRESSPSSIEEPVTPDLVADATQDCPSSNVKAKSQHVIAQKQPMIVDEPFALDAGIEQSGIGVDRVDVQPTLRDSTAPADPYRAEPRLETTYRNSSEERYELPRRPARKTAQNGKGSPSRIQKASLSPQKRASEAESAVPQKKARRSSSPCSTVRSCQILEADEILEVSDASDDDLDMFAHVKRQVRRASIIPILPPVQLSAVKRASSSNPARLPSPSLSSSKVAPKSATRPRSKLNKVLASATKAVTSSFKRANGTKKRLTYVEDEDSPSEVDESESDEGLALSSRRRKASHKPSPGDSRPQRQRKSTSNWWDLSTALKRVESSKKVTSQLPAAKRPGHGRKAAESFRIHPV